MTGVQTKCIYQLFYSLEGLPKSDSIIKWDLWPLANDNCVPQAKNQEMDYFADVQIMVLFEISI